MWHSAITGNNWQMGELAWISSVNNGAASIDQFMFIFILQQGDRHTLAKGDMDRAGKAALNNGILNPANLADIAMQILQINAKDWRTDLQITLTRQAGF